MRTRILLSTLTLLVTAAASGSAAAELYRWVDEKGVVNYGDKPPAGARNVRALDESSARVSIVPGLSPETMQRERERAAAESREQRVDQLERELQESQARERAAAQAAASATERLNRERQDPQVVLYPVVPAPHQHLVPPPRRPPPRAAPVERTKPQSRPQPPASMRVDLPPG